MGMYGQFCPVAKAMEVLDERWTLLVVRELLAGSTQFNAIRRGVPRMSPALLSKRLRTLVRAGVVARTDGGGYVLTPAGRELEPVVMALGTWGMRWIGELGDADLDPHLLLWDMHRHIDRTDLPAPRTVVQVRFPDVPGAAGRWWIVATRDEVEVCHDDPGFEVTFELVAPLRSLVQVWRGDVSWSAARDLEVTPGPHARSRVAALFTTSDFAVVPRPRAPSDVQGRRRAPTLAV